MIDPRISLKQRPLAAVLAWLIPGAGHFYQGRRLKSVIYFCSIVGLFLMAMLISEWKVMAAPVGEGPPGPEGEGPLMLRRHPNREGQRSGVPVIQMLKFGAQSGVGLPAIYSWIQKNRYLHSSNRMTQSLPSPLESEFMGEVEYTSETGLVQGRVIGKVLLEPIEGRFAAEAIRGRFVGTLIEEGREIDVPLGEGVELGRPVSGSEHRSLVGPIDTGMGRAGRIRGMIPRPFWNWLAVPLDRQQELALHGTLGKSLELATLLTVVAGLLNILAIFDAFGGPAYGYGDEGQEPVPA